MKRSPRLIAAAIGIAAVLVLGGAVLGARFIPAPNGQPVTAASSPKPEESPGAEANESPSPQKVQDVVDRLSAAGISTTAAQFTSLAQKYGVGGAVRILAFAHAAGKTPAQIATMFDGGKGWGEIRRELGLSIGPGIGWIMGHGHTKGD